MTKGVMLLVVAMGFCVTYSVATARLPAPSEEAKAKAAEAAAKSAHNGKIENYQLCLSMNKVAAKYATNAKAAGKTVTPTATPDCADPGPYVSAAEAAAKAAAAGGAATAPAPAAAAVAAAAKAAMPAAAAKAAVAPPKKS